MTLEAKLRWKAQVKKKTRRSWTKVQENILVHGEKIKPVDTQADAAQTNVKAGMDLRLTSLGMY
jgi:hypothetical protein